MTICYRCGCALPSDQAVFDAEGRTQCAACLSAGQIESDTIAVTGWVRGLGYASLALALVSFVFNPLMIAAIVSIGLAAYVYHAITHAPSSCRREGDGGDGLLKIAYASMVLSVLSFVVGVVVAFK